MSSDPAEQTPSPNRNDAMRGSYNNVRNSAHRGNIPQGQFQPDQNNSANKGRFSYLQNTQIEMQRVGAKKNESNKEASIKKQFEKNASQMNAFNVASRQNKNVFNANNAANISVISSTRPSRLDNHESPPDLET